MTSIMILSTLANGHSLVPFYRQLWSRLLRAPPLSPRLWGSTIPDDKWTGKKIATDVTFWTMHICFVSITMMYRCCHILAVFMIIPSKENNLYFRSSSIYGFLTFRIGSERAERATLMRKYVTATVAAVPDATKPWRGKMYTQKRRGRDTNWRKYGAQHLSLAAYTLNPMASQIIASSQERQCQI